MSDGLPDLPVLPNIEFLIDGNGEIAIGAVASIPCVASARDDDQCPGMLVRRDNETFQEPLMRLDRATEMAYEGEKFIDEVNNGPFDDPFDRRPRLSSMRVFLIAYQ